LLKAAEQSKGKMKEIRLANAEKIIKRVKELEIGGRKEQIYPKFETSEKEKKWLITQKPAVTFNDVAGLEGVKEEIRIKIIYPFEHPKEAKKYGISSGGGILLYGPPGTGKSFIAKAIANEVDAFFFSITPSDIMSKWVGESEQNIDELFKMARSHPKSVIFIDEVEALVPKRRNTDSTVMKRLVPQILAEMDGMNSDNSNILFIGATNEPWSLDPAILRPGRFGEKIYVPPPDIAARKKLFELYLKNRPLSNDIDYDLLSEASKSYSGADIKEVCIKASVIPFKESIQTGIERDIGMQDIKKALEIVKPSIEAKDLKKFEEYFFNR
jgi:transitional endoplasmic reticulum ATPase